MASKPASASARPTVASSRDQLAPHAIAALLAILDRRSRGRYAELLFAKKRRSSFQEALHRLPECLDPRHANRLPPLTADREVLWIGRFLAAGNATRPATIFSEFSALDGKVMAVTDAVTALYESRGAGALVAGVRVYVQGEPPGQRFVCEKTDAKKSTGA